MKIKKQIPLFKYTTIGIGGRVQYFIEVNNKSELKDAFEFIKNKGLKYFVLGGGSNLLVEDKDLNIAIIKPLFSNILINERRVEVEAALKLPRLLNILFKEELSGLEELAEIPGETGGAVRMNAGSFGREIGEVVEEIEVFDGKEFIKIASREIGFSYRKTNIKSTWIITNITLKLAKGRKAKILSILETVKGKRRKSQPVGEKTFGSVFKNPKGYSSGYLIERCGLKGYRINDAKISEKHANFIINTGKATFGDIISLMEMSKKAVFNRFKIKLEPEVIILRGN